MTDKPLHELTATEAAGLIRARLLSPEDLLEALLDRIDAVAASTRGMVTLRSQEIR